MKPSGNGSVKKSPQIYVGKLQQKVRENVDSFFVGLAERAIEVMQRCRRVLRVFADKVALTATPVDVDLMVRSV